jgi:hypothetical protein
MKLTILEIESHWGIYALLMYPCRYAAKIYRPKFESSPTFKTEKEAQDWLELNHPSRAILKIE